MATIPRTILVAPDSFKGTFSARQVASAIGRGLEAKGRPVDLCPLADGGEGTLEVLLELSVPVATVSAMGTSVDEEVAVLLPLSLDDTGGSMTTVPGSGDGEHDSGAGNYCDVLRVADWCDLQCLAA